MLSKRQNGVTKKTPFRDHTCFTTILNLKLQFCDNTRQKYGHQTGMVTKLCRLLNKTHFFNIFFKFFNKGICWNFFLIIYNLPNIIRKLCFLIKKGREIELRDAIPFIVGIKSLVFQFVNIFTMVSNLNLNITPQYVPITSDAFKTIGLMVFSSLGPMISNDSLLNITLPTFNLASNINERSLFSLELHNFNIAQNIYQQFAFHYQANTVISNTYIQEGISLVNQSNVLAERYQINLVNNLTQLSDSVVTVNDLQVKAGQVVQNGVTNANTATIAVSDDHIVNGSLFISRGGMISASEVTVSGDVQVNNVQLSSNELLISSTGSVMASNGSMQLKNLTNAGQLELTHEQVDVSHTYTGEASSSALFNEQTHLNADEAIIGGGQILSNASIVTKNSILFNPTAQIEALNVALLLSKEIHVDSNTLLNNATLNIIADDKLTFGSSSNIHAINSALNIQAKQVEQMQHGRINMDNVTLVADKLSQQGEMNIDLSNIFVEQHEISGSAVYSSSNGVHVSKETTVDSGAHFKINQTQMQSGDIKVGDGSLLDASRSQISANLIKNEGGTVQGKEGTLLLLKDYCQSGGTVNLSDSNIIAQNSLVLTDGTNLSIQGQSGLQSAQVKLNSNSSAGTTIVESESTLNVTGESINLGGNVVGGGSSSLNIGAEHATIGNLIAGNLNFQVKNDLVQSADTFIVASNVQMLVKQFEQMGQMRAKHADVNIKDAHVIEKQGGLMSESGTYKTGQTDVKGEMSVKNADINTGSILVDFTGELNVTNSTLNTSNINMLNVMNAANSQINVEGAYTAGEQSHSTLTNAGLKANQVTLAGEQTMSNSKIEATKTLDFKSTSTLNVESNSSAQLTGKNIAMHANRINLDEKSSIAINATNDLQMSSDVKGANATMMIKAATGNLDSANMILSNLKVDVGKLSDASIQNILHGNGAINVADTNMIITNANITVDKELAPSKNVDITADSINVIHEQTRGSDGTLKLEASVGNVQVDAGLRGKDIYLVSEQANVKTNADIHGQNIYVKAQDSFINSRDAHLKASQSLNVRAEAGHIENRGILY